MHRVQYGARLQVDEGDKVKRGQRMAEWDPYTRPILTEVDGTVGYEDLVDGASMTETTDEVDRHHQARRHRLARHRPHRGPAAGDRHPATRAARSRSSPRGGEARYLLPVDAILSVDPGAKVKAGDVLARISDRERQDARHHRRSAARGGAVRGAPAEGRGDHRRDSRARSSSAATTRTSVASARRRTTSSEPIEYLIPKGKHSTVQEGDVVEKGDYILDGNPAPHDILAIKGVEELASYLVNEIQEVYRLQGVTINDKHIEVIVRQMLQKVEITDRRRFRRCCRASSSTGSSSTRSTRSSRPRARSPATGMPVLLGITKASLQTRSFISAASFQETTRVLTEAAVNGKVDTLEGLKENVIVGRLIPAGTGGMLARFKQVADKRDDLILGAAGEAAVAGRAGGRRPSSGRVDAAASTGDSSPNDRCRPARHYERPSRTCCWQCRGTRHKSDVAAYRLAMRVNLRGVPTVHAASTSTARRADVRAQRSSVRLGHARPAD